MSFSHITPKMVKRIEVKHLILVKVIPETNEVQQMQLLRGKYYIFES